MKHTVVLTAAFPIIARAILAEDFDVVEHPTEHNRTEEDMITLLDEADAAITLLQDPPDERVHRSSFIVHRSGEATMVSKSSSNNGDCVRSTMRPSSWSPR